MGYTKLWCVKHHLVMVAENCYNSADRWRWHNVAQDYVKLMPRWQQTLWGSSSSLPSVRWISCISGCPHQVTKTYLPSRKGWRKGLMWYFSHQDSPLTTPDSIFNANEHKSLGWKEGKDSRRYQNPGQQRRSSFCSGCLVVQHLHGQEILWCYCRQRAAETEKLILPSRKQRRSKSYEQVQTVSRPEQRLLKSDSHYIPDNGLLTCISP